MAYAEYDFGDGWRQPRSCSRDSSPWSRRRSTCSAEGERPAHQKTAAGRGATEIFSPPLPIRSTSRHDELLEWRGPFAPEAFDAKKATKEMRKVK